MVVADCLGGGHVIGKIDKLTVRQAAELMPPGPERDMLHARARNLCRWPRWEEAFKPAREAILHEPRTRLATPVCEADKTLHSFESRRAEDLECAKRRRLVDAYMDKSTLLGLERGYHTGRPSGRREAEPV